MGYPMTYSRVVSRNWLSGDYGDRRDHLMIATGLVAGDLRRLEVDQRDEYHLNLYAEKVGITPAQVKQVLDLFLTAMICIASSRQRT